MAFFKSRAQTATHSESVKDDAQSLDSLRKQARHRLIGATVFSLVFQGVDGGRWIEHMLGALPGGQVGFLIAVNLFVFFLAFFLDFFEIAFIVVPLLAPVAQKMGIDLVWFGVLLCVTMQTSFMHPPFGFALFYLRGIASKEVKSSDIYWGAIPWVVLQLILVAILIFWPGLVTGFLDAPSNVDPTKVEIQIEIEQQMDQDDVTRQNERDASGEKSDANDASNAIENAYKQPQK